MGEKEGGVCLLSDLRTGYLIQKAVCWVARLGRLVLSFSGLYQGPCIGVVEGEYCNGGAAVREWQVVELGYTVGL